jgi:hypothetical protein
MLFAPRNFKDAADDISKGPQNLRLLNQPGGAALVGTSFDKLSDA